MEEYKIYEYTIQITTKSGMVDYLIMDLHEGQYPTDEMVLELFDLYKNDEAGKALKNEELESYSIIRKD